MLLGSVKKLQVEDYLMIVAMVRHHHHQQSTVQLSNLIILAAVYRYRVDGRNVDYFANEQ